MRWIVGHNKYLSCSEVKTVLTKVAELSKRDRQNFKDIWFKIETLLMIAFNLGTRCQEMKMIRHGDLFLDDEIPFVQVRGKNKRARCIPINTALKRSLLLFISHKKSMGQPTNADALLFISPRGTYYSTGTFEQWFKRAMAVSGIRRKLSLHKCRHTFARNYYLVSEKDLIGLSQLLGHADVSTTSVYTDVTFDTLSKNCQVLFTK